MSLEALVNIVRGRETSETARSLIKLVPQIEANLKQPALIEDTPELRNALRVVSKALGFSDTVFEVRHGGNLDMRGLFLDNFIAKIEIVTDNQGLRVLTASHIGR